MPMTIARPTDAGYPISPEARFRRSAEARAGLAFLLPKAYPVATIVRRGKAMPIRIYHNPQCNTSRKTLALLREKGIEPEIVEYLKTPYTAAQLKTLLGQLKMPAGALLRKREAAAAGIDPAKLSEDAIIAAMVKNPIIVERPIVVSGIKAALGRPPEKVLEVL
jgi:arsenate reductase (glutaredoxin)